MKKEWQLLILFVWVGVLTGTDRYFFKRNGGFCIRFIYPSIENNPEWDLPPVSAKEAQELDQILNQTFTYFAKGAQMYAFLSDDGRYVIKFHRYPSHMRLFPWLNHPIAYHFNPRRIKIKYYNLEQYDYYMRNYKASSIDLKEETGIVFLHINRTLFLKRCATIVDKTGTTYKVPLDQVTFAIQKKAELVQPILEKLIKSGDIEGAKKVISHVIALVQRTCEKGYVNNDPVLERNFGLLADRAIYIDIGDLSKEEHSEEYKQEVLNRVRALVGHSPELLSLDILRELQN